MSPFYVPSQSQPPLDVKIGPLPGGTDSIGGVDSFSLNNTLPPPKSVKDESEIIPLLDTDILFEEDTEEGLSASGSRGKQRPRPNLGPLLDDPPSWLNQSISDLLTLIATVPHYLKSVARRLVSLLSPIVEKAMELASSNKKIGIGIASATLVLLFIIVVLAFFEDNEESKSTEHRNRVAAAPKTIESSVVNGVPSRAEMPLGDITVRSKAAHSDPKNQAVEQSPAVEEESIKNDTSGHETTVREDEQIDNHSKPVTPSNNQSVTLKNRSQERSESSGSDEKRQKKRNARHSRKAESNPSSDVIFGKNADGELPVRLSRDAVQFGMNRIAKKVKKCAKKEHRPIVMSITIGKHGKVTHATATGSFVGTTIGRCAANVVRTAAFPPAKQAITIKYPFHL